VTEVLRAELAPTVGSGAAARPEPLFLLAPARSHSTVSIALLAGHPGIYGFPELLMFSVPRSTPTVGALLAAKNFWPPLPVEAVLGRQSGVLRTLADLHEGCQEPYALERARRWLQHRREWPTVELMNYLLDMVAPRVGLEKSPDTVSTEARLEACLTAFPNARYLHLTRHPVTTQQSMHAHRAGRFGWDRKTLVVASASQWYLSHRLILRALAKLPDRQWMRIRAEDLLRQPAAHLPQVLSWLGLQCDAEIIARMIRTQDWRFASSGPDGNLYGGDRKFLNSPALRAPSEPGPVSFDPAWGLSEEMCKRMQALATYLGY
jgi:hypothetical protein